MADSETGVVTALLHRAVAGDRSAEDALYRLVFPELRRRAGALMRRRALCSTQQATGIVNEAWERLGLDGADGWSGKSHFLAVASKALRSVLVDHARRRMSEKRGGRARREPLDGLVFEYERRSMAILDLEAALERLWEDDPLAVRIVELRFFGGLSMPEVAAALGIGLRTAERTWRAARARLMAELA